MRVWASASACACVVAVITGVSCSSNDSGAGTPVSGGGAGGAGVAGASGTAGVAGASGTSGAGQAGGDGSAGQGGTDGSAGSGGVAGSAGSGGSAGVAGEDPVITFASLNAAYVALNSGSDDVAVSVDGREHFVRTPGATSDDEIDELSIDGTVIMRVTHTLLSSHWDLDTNNDGVFDWQADASHGTPASVVISSDPTYTGAATRRVTLTQVSSDTVHVKIEAADAGGFVTVSESDAPILQAATAPSVSSPNCSASELSTAADYLQLGLDQGLECLRKYGVKDILRAMTAMFPKKGVEFTCSTSASLCAQASFFDSITQGAFGSTVGVNINLNNSASACSNPPMTIFHELIHISTGLSHRLGFDASTFDSLATDRVYSCADVCFRGPDTSNLATQCECATCLQTSTDDPRCANFVPCGATIRFEQADCSAVTSCPCGITTGSALAIHISATARGPVGVYATLPNPTAVPANAQLDCGEWTPAPNDALGAGVACRHDPGQPYVTKIDITAPYTCECAPGTNGTYPAYIAIMSTNPKQGGFPLADAFYSMVCP